MTDKKLLDFLASEKACVYSGAFGVWYVSTRYIEVKRRGLREALKQAYKEHNKGRK